MIFRPQDMLDQLDNSHGNCNDLLDVSIVLVTCIINMNLYNHTLSIEYLRRSKVFGTVSNEVKRQTQVAG